MAIMENKKGDSSRREHLLEDLLTEMYDYGELETIKRHINIGEDGEIKLPKYKIKKPPKPRNIRSVRQLDRLREKDWKREKEYYDCSEEEAILRYCFTGVVAREHKWLIQEVFEKMVSKIKRLEEQVSELEKIELIKAWLERGKEEEKLPIDHEQKELQYHC